MVRPSLYDSRKHPRLAKLYAKKGLTTYDIAAKFGISRTTLYNWSKSHPEFMDALMHGRQFIVSEVILSTFQRARGYDVEEVKTIGVPDKRVKDDGTEEEFIRVIRVEKTKKHYPGSDGASKLFLNAYAPEDFRNSTELTGKDGGPIQTEEVMSRDELLKLAKEAIRLSGE